MVADNYAIETTSHFIKFTENHYLLLAGVVVVGGTFGYKLSIL